MKKNNNKGFSLVELIVVVLIIAIIAVALAPQVIKWVDRARENVQQGDMATIKSCFNAAVAEYLAEGGRLDDDAVYYIRDKKLWDSSNASQPEATDRLAALVDEILQSDYPEVMKPSGNKFKITVDKNMNVVTVELVD